MIGGISWPHVSKGNEPLSDTEELGQVLGTKGSNVFYGCAQVSTRDRFTPAAERFRRVNPERFVLENEVRADGIQDEALSGVVSLGEPSGGSIADRKESVGNITRVVDR